jgi:hypothetical protein
VHTLLHNRVVPWLPMYLLNDDVSLLVERLDSDADLAWQVQSVRGVGLRPSTILPWSHA